ncbi:MAG: PTS sugar transporter subunit IIA [Spirochaetes bacterium]|nr:PTS sugar transporter subunit IIA [Spirochaetota bacterium]
MNLGKIFTPEQIVFLESTQKQLAIKELINRLHDLGKISSAARYYAQVIHRESLENTGIGHGFAIPHTRTDSISELNVIFGISREGIDYMAYDNEPVHFIMLSIFPTEMSTSYLYLVSMVAGIFKNKDKLSRLQKSETPKEIYDLLKDNAEKYYENISVTDNKHVTESANLAGVPSSDLDFIIKLDRLYKMSEEQNPESLKEKINGIRALIDNRSLTYYDRMRTKCENAFAIVEKNACSGCHMKIPPIEVNEIRKRTKISVCSHCGRFLIFL